MQSRERRPVNKSPSLKSYRSAGLVGEDPASPNSPRSPRLAEITRRKEEARVLPELDPNLGYDADSPEGRSSPLTSSDKQKNREKRRTAGKQFRNSSRRGVKWLDDDSASDVSRASSRDSFYSTGRDSFASGEPRSVHSAPPGRTLKPEVIQRISADPEEAERIAEEAERRWQVRKRSPPTDRGVITRVKNAKPRRGLSR